MSVTPERSRKMSDGIRWWLHSHRPKHERRMAFAESCVEKSVALRRMSQREQDSEMLVAGFQEIRRAIASVVDCGCPRWLWRESVRKQVGGG